MRPSIAALARRALETLPDRTAWMVATYQRGVIPGRAQALDQHIWGPDGRAFVDAFESVRAALRAHGPTVELFRGEPADVERVRRAFLPWTDDRDEAAGFGMNGVLRRAQVPVACILAVFPHGRGLEYLVTPECSGQQEAPPVLGRLAWVEIDPARASGYGEPYWLDGAKVRRRAEAAFARHRVIVRDWRPRSADDEDYWSGYDPAPNHGTYRVEIPVASAAALAAELARIGLRLE